jgi:O-succinylbenzoate synthase
VSASLLEQLELYPVCVPMKHRFRRVTVRDAVLMRGPAGWGEFSPFPDYPPEVTTRWLASALESACVPLPEPLRDRVPVNVTVPAVAPDVAARMVATSGCTTAKVKVAEPGQDASADEARVAAVREALGPEGRLRIDVNAAWDLDTAAEQLTKLSAYGLEYVEQPVASLEDMIELRKRVEVPIAADEAVRMAVDPLQVAEAGAADIIVIKVQPLGGVRRALDLAARSGLPVVVSSALETSVGICAGVAAAAGLPDLPYACGLGTVALLEGDVVSEPMLAEGGWMRVRRPEPDPRLLERWAAGRETAGELLRRLRWAAEVLT